MVANCSYAKKIWSLLVQRASITFVQNSMPLSNVQEWWECLTLATGLGHVQLRQTLIYVTWNIWKERCRRVFDNKALPPNHLAQLILQDVAAYRQTRANPVVWSLDTHPVCRVVLFVM